MRLTSVISIVVFLASGCAPHVVRAKGVLPPLVQQRLSALSRVWVAGFIDNSQPEPRQKLALDVETIRLLRGALREQTSATVVEAEPLRISGKEQFDDARYWRQRAEEHDFPLIVTGSVRMILAPPRIEQRAKRTFYFARAGRVLDATIVTIDGTSGRITSTQPLRRRMRYGDGPAPPGLGLFFEMMDDAMPEWLAAISAAPLDASGGLVESP